MVFRTSSACSAASDAIRDVPKRKKLSSLFMENPIVDASIQKPTTKGKLSSLFKENPVLDSTTNHKPTSRFFPKSKFLSFPHENRVAATTSNPKPTTQSSIPNIQIRTPLENFLEVDCKLGNVQLNDALNFFDQMLLLQPFPPVSSFNALLAAVAKIKGYNVVISMYNKMNAVNISPHHITLNILLNCYCSVNRVDFAFAVLGGILKSGSIPTTVTCTSLIKGLFMRHKIGEAVGLFKKMVESGCRPDSITCGTLINGLCRAGKSELAVRLHE